MLDRYQSTLGTLGDKHPLIGLALQYHLTSRGGPMIFRDKPFLVELYSDFLELEGADIRKAVQVGASELFVLLMLHHAGWAGRIAAYVLPTAGSRDDFVKRRINPPLINVPEYRRRCPGGRVDGGKADKGSLRLKAFGGGTLMFLGSNTPTDFLEFTADLLIIDEFDECEPVNLAKAIDRLVESPYPQTFRLGNPTQPRAGISRLYDEGDGRRWYVRCPHCGERQPVDWFENVVRKTTEGWELRDREAARTGREVRPVCRRCREPFERSAEGAAWIPERPSAERRSYWMSRLDVLSASLRKFWREWLEAQGDSLKLGRFCASVLGFAYEKSGSRLTVEALDNASKGDDADWLGDEKYAEKTVTMGVDVGAVLNVSVSVTRAPPELKEGENASEAPEDRRGEARPEMDDDEADRRATEAPLRTWPVREAVWVGAVVHFEELDDIVERYHVDCCVVDAKPETREARKFRDRMNLTGRCQVWLCNYHPTDKVEGGRFGWKLNWVDSIVTVDRTQAMDAAFDDIRYGRRWFPQDTMSSVLGWSEQMRAPVRLLDEKKQRIVWEEGSAADHYRHADVYDLIAHELSQMGGSFSVI